MYHSSYSFLSCILYLLFIVGIIVRKSEFYSNFSSNENTQLKKDARL